MAAEETRGFALTLQRAEDYRFTVVFDQAATPALQVDEAPPLGGGAGPNPARMLGTAVGHCLASSLLFCLQKARVPVEAMAVAVTGSIVRNEKGRFRVGALQVTLRPVIAAEDLPRIGRCLEVFEDFCIVTQSVRQGVDVSVHVEPQTPA